MFSLPPTRLPSRTRDVSSPYARRAKHCVMERLDRFDREENAWQEVLVEDKLD